jgi:beta-lactamase regulating signal transducer with metallopeptidase domain
MMNPLPDLAGENIISALGWTLIHSLWQISLLGLLLKISLIAFRKRSAEFRYLLTTVSLFAITIVSVITFTKIYSTGVPSSQTVLSEFSVILSEQNQLNSGSFNASGTIRGSEIMAIFETLSRFINANLRLIVVLWLAGTVFFSLRFAGSYLYANRLKYKNTLPVSRVLMETIALFVQKLNIKRKIKIVESLVVKIPMVIGHFKPFIIMPAGLATALPYDQVEAIIAHELAHIKRNDYFINILKSILEVIYFYHPVIWWISSLIEKERENCCDDITIEICGNEKPLQSALLSLEQFEQKSIFIAAALLNKNYKLLNRIRRMKTTNQFKHGFRGSLAGFIILLGGIIILTTSSAFSPKGSDLPKEYLTQEVGILTDNILSGGSKAMNNLSQNEVTNPVHEIIVNPLSPDTVKGSTALSPEEKAKVTLELDGNYNLISVKKDGKLLDGDEKKEYEAMAEKLKKLSEQEKEKEDQHLAMEKAEKELQIAQEKIEKAREEYEKAMEAYNKNLYETVESKHSNVMVWSEMDSEDPQVVKEVKIVRHPDFPDTPETYSFNLSEDAFAEAYSESLKDVDRVITISGDNLKKLDDLDKEMKMIEIHKEMDGPHGSNKVIIRHSGSDNLLPTLRKELVNDGVLKSDDEKLTFSLTQDEVEVNGKKLSGELHKKYLKIYRQSTGNKLNGEFKIVIKD